MMDDFEQFGAILGVIASTIALSAFAYLSCSRAKAIIRVIQLGPHASVTDIRQARQTANDEGVSRVMIEMQSFLHSRGYYQQAQNLRTVTHTPDLEEAASVRNSTTPEYSTEVTGPQSVPGYQRRVQRELTKKERSEQRQQRQSQAQKGREGEPLNGLHGSSQVAASSFTSSRKSRRSVRISPRSSPSQKLLVPFPKIALPHMKKSQSTSAIRPAQKQVPPPPNKQEITELLHRPSGSFKIDKPPQSFRLEDEGPNPDPETVQRMRQSSQVRVDGLSDLPSYFDFMKTTPFSHQETSPSVPQTHGQAEQQEQRDAATAEHRKKVKGETV
ncbi:MAG: hypothetical protein Q9162_001992 [Coniocarpon cinnabarinum]